MHYLVHLNLEIAFPLTSRGDGASIPPKPMMHFSLYFRFLLFHKIFQIRVCAKFYKIDHLKKMSSSTKICDDQKSYISPFSEKLHFPIFFTYSNSPSFPKIYVFSA